MKNKVVGFLLTLESNIVSFLLKARLRVHLLVNKAHKTSIWHFNDAMIHFLRC